MYWDSNNQYGEEIRVYHEAVEYGILCKIQDLEAVVAGLDRHIKKSKVCGSGMHRRFGVITGIPESRDHNFYEWRMDSGCAKSGRLTEEQGHIWHFDLQPNRHYRINEQGAATEVYAFPERKDISYYFMLIKFGIERDDQETREKRQAFFRKLIDSIGFPVEKLYEYGKDEDRIAR